MAGFTVNQPVQIQVGNAVGVTMVGPNTRVRGTLGFFGTAADALAFAGGITGQWVAPCVRVRANGAFLVAEGSIGLSQSGTIALPIPVTVVTGDPRVRSM
jgi:hypothetical protein